MMTEEIDVPEAEGWVELGPLRFYFQPKLHFPLTIK